MNEHDAMKPEVRHLMFEDFVRLLSSPVERDTAAEHLARCTECREMLESIRHIVGAEPQRAKAATGSLCLTQEQISLLAGRVFDKDTASSFARHISECERCGASLREAVEVMQAALTPDEERLVAEALLAPPMVPSGPKRQVWF